MYKLHWPQGGAPAIRAERGARHQVDPKEPVLPGPPAMPSPVKEPNFPGPPVIPGGLMMAGNESELSHKQCQEPILTPSLPSLLSSPYAPATSPRVSPHSAGDGVRDLRSRSAELAIEDRRGVNRNDSRLGSSLPRSMSVSSSNQLFIGQVSGFRYCYIAN